MDIRKWQDKFSVDVALKYSSRSTVENYKSCVFTFLKHFENEVQPKAIPTAKIKEYMLGFETLNTRKANLCAVKAFYRLTVKMPTKIDAVPYPKKARKLPRVIEKNFLLERIGKIKNLKHKAILSLGFSVGLRVSEVINLKIEDIDSGRMLIHVRNAKGNKDRFVPLSQPILKLLRDYVRQYRPVEFLFNGQNDSPQYSTTSCNQIVKKYLGNKYHYHLLRHSCFTSMMESGTDIRIIQKIAGHRSTKTTEIYTHVSNDFLSQVATPI
tara:strand:- start:59283 stop:60086 length:804 start_codon:yes stop_codon:yes gene_type:complete